MFEQAAALGHDDAIASLATIYINGNGVEIDYAKGLKYLEKSVNNGNVYSTNLLGILYLEGKGVEQNYEQALISFNIAAENGYPYAMLNSSELYLEGKGTDTNIKKGIQCLLDAIDVWGEAENDYSVYPTDWQMQAHEQLDKLLEDKEYIPVLEEIATEGNRVAQYYMYHSYMTAFLDSPSSFTEKNYEKILPWLIKSADNGFPNAQYELGICYHDGISGCNKDVQKGIFYLSQAADQEHAGAVFWLKSNNKNTK